MSNESINKGGRPYTSASLSEAASNASRPEFFRLPKSGGDPFFGFGRSFYYRGEQLGYWRLVRIRERGKLRGVTLVPYDDVSAFVRSRKDTEANEANAQRSGDGGDTNGV